VSLNAKKCLSDWHKTDTAFLSVLDPHPQREAPL
jgi:hypothetical protein